MKFEQITNEDCGARKAGYMLDLAAPLMVNQAAIDDLHSRRGESAVNSTIDGLCDNDGDLFRGEDGEYYAVAFDYGAPAPYPVLAWHRLTKR